MVRRSHAALIGVALVIVAVAGVAVLASDDDPAAGPTVGGEPEVLGDRIEREPDDRNRSQAAQAVSVEVIVRGEEGASVSVALIDPTTDEPLDAQQGSTGEYALTAPGPGTWALMVDWTNADVIDIGGGGSIGGGASALRHMVEVSGPGPVRLVCSSNEGCTPA
jgi:hypothetical protein